VLFDHGSGRTKPRATDARRAAVAAGALALALSGRGCSDDEPTNGAGGATSGWSGPGGATGTGANGGGAAASGGHGGSGGAALTRARFAVIGDFGFAAISPQGAADEAAVANLVASWSPEFVVTVGDNNYPDGTAETIDDNIGQFYQAFISPYVGSYGEGAAENRFFPALGNHDWNTGNVDAHLAYFALPGNERYWDVVRGPVHLFVVDSDEKEPDGIAFDSTQGKWLQQTLSASSSPFDLVFLHHAPYSSGEHGSTAIMQWPYASWGAQLVMAGHDHDYERLEAQGIPFVVNGFGGADLRPIESAIPESQVRYDAEHGAMLIEADDLALTMHAITVSGQIVDAHAITATEPSGAATLVPTGASWRYRDDGADLGNGWRDPAFDDSAWASGAAPLGYGEVGLGTEIGFGVDPMNKHLTTYLRLRFTADDLGAAKLLLRVVRDDGVAVYLNGVEAYRSNLPAAATASTPASYTVADVAEGATLAAGLDAGLLVAGENVLAVEIHQSTPQSSDLRFDLSLLAFE
jgi:hypothetical protein